MSTLSKRDRNELAFFRIAKAPINKDNATYQRLAGLGYLIRTKHGYIITDAGRQALDRT